MRDTQPEGIRSTTVHQELNRIPRAFCKYFTNYFLSHLSAFTQDSTDRQGLGSRSPATHGRRLQLAFRRPKT